MDLVKSCTDTKQEVEYFERILNELSGKKIPEERMWNQKKDDTVGQCAHHSDEYSCDDGVQAVLGRLSQTKEYIACPEFLVLNIKGWTIDQNDLFIEGISRPFQLMSNKSLCKIFPIRLLHAEYPEHTLETDHQSGMLRTSIIPGSVTRREICLLNAKGYTFYQPKDKLYYLLSKDPSIELPGLDLAG
jgi:hypothetical protein